MYRLLILLLPCVSFILAPGSADADERRGKGKQKGHQRSYHKAPNKHHKKAHHNKRDHRRKKHHRSHYEDHGYRFHRYDGIYGYRSAVYIEILPGFTVTIPIDDGDRKRHYRWPKDKKDWRYPDEYRHRDRRDRGDRPRRDRYRD